MGKATLIFGLLFVLQGCANRPEAIRATHVSHERFLGQDCRALTSKLADSRRDLDRMSKMQDSKANVDAVGVFLIGVPFSKLSGDHEGEIARLKGEIEAIETAQTKSRCFATTQPQTYPSAPNSVRARLEELKRMYNGGLITFDEYEEKRKKVLTDL